jgi:large subunit ribosomal protein L5
MKHCLKIFYIESIVKKFRQEFKYKNIHEVPRLEKIVLNRGLGRIALNNNDIERSIFDVTLISAQRGCVTRSHRSIAGFGIRSQAPVGVIVTLRRKRIYAFFDRLINLTLPSIRHFCGLRTKSFDGHGGYNLGIQTLHVFPEVDTNPTPTPCGINISMVTSSRIDKERFILLKAMGLPFPKNIYGS